MYTGARYAVRVPATSKIDAAGLGAEALELYHSTRGSRNAKGSAVRRWLQTKGVSLDRSTVIRWCARRSMTPEVSQAIAPTVAVVHGAPLADPSPELSHIMDMARRQIEDGTATTGSAKVLEVWLKAVLARRIMGDG